MFSEPQKMTQSILDTINQIRAVDAEKAREAIQTHIDAGCDDRTISAKLPRVPLEAIQTVRALGKK